MKPMISAGVALALVSAAPLVAAGPATVSAVVCTGVKDRAPVGAGETFPPSVGELTCFTEVTGGSGTIVHAWFHGATEVRRIELPVKAARWRTWSVKRIPPGMTGAWRVEVRDSAGAVLATAAFAVN